MQKFTSLKTFWQYLAPQHALSVFGGWLAACKIPWVKRYLIAYFLGRYEVNLAEAVEPNPENYLSFNHFFTRALRAEVRPIEQEMGGIISPVDGSVSQMGAIQEGKIFQAKKHYFSLSDLVAGDAQLTKNFQNGYFCTIYLAPHDYHRVHIPLKAILKKTIYIPGKLFSVNPLTAETVPNLFARNERLVCSFSTEYGEMLVIFVGAMVVGKITTVWQDHNERKPKKITTQNYHDLSLQLNMGDLIGQFSLGSTVLVLFNHEVVWQDLNKIKMGQLIGKIPVSSPS